MRFSIQRETFLKPLKAVAGVVERRQLHMLPILSNVLIDVQSNSFSLTTTDQEVELIAFGELNNDNGEIVPGKLTVPLRKLLDICRALPDSATLTLSQEQDKVIIRAGRSRFTLSMLPAEQFPSLSNSVGDISLDVSNKSFKRLIDSVSFAMAEQDVRYYLNGMLLDVKEGGLYAVAADGHRLAQNTLEVLQGRIPRGMRVIIPRKGVIELQRVLEEDDQAITLMLGSSHLRVITKTVTLTTKLLEGKFPDYERIIPQNGSKVVTGQRGLLKEAFLRASTLFTDKSRSVRLKLTANCLKILATNAEQDEVEEDIEVEYSGEELEIGFNVKYLIDFLSVIQEDKVRFTFSDANSSARVEGWGDDKGIYVVMPTRI